ncbi:MAG TPA: transcriptional regulator [Gallionella sp.]|nr:MAG: transcriptional regulator [Gallionellales bacterium GWA2_54_124]OGT17280.1 MAG: transcriptional regulator [Gallionellales bacterium RIFOXYD12_FULL_53_10]HCI53077.1 transcriptional regulator [Gallionella sp.]
MAFNTLPIGFARETLATNMRAFRAERGWSQEFLAFETGLHRTFIAHCERGARNISLDNIEKIARAFNVPIASLFSMSQ